MYLVIFELEAATMKFYFNGTYLAIATWIIKKKKHKTNLVVFSKTNNCAKKELMSIQAEIVLHNC